MARRLSSPTWRRHRDIAGAGSRSARCSSPPVTRRASRPSCGASSSSPDLRTDLGRTGRLWCLEERTWSDLAAGMRSAHAAAAKVNRDAAAAREAVVPSPALRVGLVADEFTTETLAASVQVVPLDRDRWRADVESGLDLVFIESAWKGNGGQWHRGVGYYSPEEHADIAGRARGSPASEASPRSSGTRRTRSTSSGSCAPPRCATTSSRRTATGSCPTSRRASGRVKSASSLPFYAQPTDPQPAPRQATLRAERRLRRHLLRGALREAVEGAVPAARDGPPLRAGHLRPAGDGPRLALPLPGRLPERRARLPALRRGDRLLQGPPRQPQRQLRRRLALDVLAPRRRGGRLRWASCCPDPAGASTRPSAPPSRRVATRPCGGPSSGPGRPTRRSGCARPGCRCGPC